MKTELNNNDLENIIGGKIEHTWDNSNGGSGTIWITARNPRVYSFNNHYVITYISEKQNEGWSDQEIMDKLVELGKIW